MADASPDAGGSKSEFEEELSDIEDFVSEAQESIDDYIARLQSEDRSRIAKMIVWLFMIACLGTLGFIVVSVLGDAKGWQDGAKQMVVVLSSIILPVVTLVIGYYFGAETKQK